MKFLPGFLLCLQKIHPKPKYMVQPDFPRGPAVAEQPLSTPLSPAQLKEGLRLSILIAVSRKAHWPGKAAFPLPPWAQHSSRAKATFLYDVFSRAFVFSNVQSSSKLVHYNYALA